MNDNFDISVIIPTCNSARYLCACLDSVRSQSLQNIEILCIDAFSDDGTTDILQAYSGKDSRIRVIPASVRSYGFQVNLGLREATGKYCAIVDSDDEISPGMYKRLFEVAEQKNADFVKADYYGIMEDKNGSAKEKKIQILAADGPYGRIVDIFRHQECFRPDVVGVWSGIYRRSFLEKHGVRLNETPGASFQDTGFWIQSYVHAQRAVFLAEPLYRYRLDNPGSSVSVTGKEYCICDEFEFAMNFLVNERLMERFSNRLSWVFYRKYKRNLERFPVEKRVDFLQRFSDDFRKWDNVHRIQDEYFLPEEYKEMLEIMEHPVEYYEKVKLRKAEFLSGLCNNAGHPLIVYGCGRVGDELARIKGIKERIKMFAVSKLAGKSSFCGKPVYAIDDLAHLRELATLVIAVKLPEHKFPMRRMAEELGFVDIREIPQGVFDIA